MKYAIFDEQGFPKAFYDDQIHTDIPKEAIQITEQQWLEFVNNQGKRKWDFDEKVVVVYEPPPPSLNELKAQKQKELLRLEKQRLNDILDQYSYNGLADVELYASQNDPEAQVLLSWYQAYDDAIWNWLDNELQAITDIEQLLQLDLKAVEQQIFDQSIQTAPLPSEE